VIGLSDNARSGIIREKMKDRKKQIKTKKQLINERDDFMRILNTMADGVYVIDQDYNIHYVNSSLQEDFGAVGGRKCYKYFHDRERICPWCKNADAFAGKTVRWEWYSSKTKKTYDVIDTPLKNAAGNTLKLEILRDITEYKRLERELRQEKDILQEYLNIAGVILIVIGIDGRVQRINNKGCMILGYRQEEIVGKNWFDNFLPERIRGQVKEVFNKVIAGNMEMIDYFENPVLTSSGKERIISWSNVSVKDEAGRVVGGFSSGEDVTERKKIEVALRESEERYRSIFETAANLILSVNKEGVIVECNKRVEQYLGYGKDELIGQSVEKIIHPDYFEQAREHLKEVLREGFSYSKDCKMIRKDGVVIDLRINSAVLRDNRGEISHVVCIMEDVTEQIKAAEELVKTKDRLNFLLQSSPAIIYTCKVGKEWETTYVSENIFNVLGYSSAEFLSGPEFWISHVHPEDRERIVSELEAIFTIGSHIHEYRFLCKDGKYVWIYDKVNLIYDSNGTPVEAVGYIIDISECKRVEEALRESEEKYRALVNYSSDAIILADLDGNFLEVNNRAEELFGYTREEFLTMNFTQIHPEKELEMARRSFYDMVQKKKGVVRDLLGVKKDGTQIPVDITASVIEYREKKVMQGVFRDVSWRKKIDQMKDNLIRDVSHEIKTPIATLEMAYDMCRRGLESHDLARIEKSQDIAFYNIDRLRKDIDNILNFALVGKKKEIEEGMTFVSKAVDEILKDEKYYIEEKSLRFETNILPDADKIKIEERELRILLYNCIDNAIKFTSEGGVFITSRLKGEYIEIEIRDTGCGIVDKDKIFERFYQRNTAIPGTGLGLSICKEIVDRYEGRIEVQSQGVDKGTTVLISLPKIS
jgi:PAS domain S-box-containing protein